MTPQEIEAAAKKWTVQDVIYQLADLPDEVKQLPFSVFSSEYGDEKPGGYGS
jgi:hypothetical protein